MQVTSALILSKVAQKVVLFLMKLSSWLPTPQYQFLDVRFRFVPSLVLHWELFECMPNVSTKTTAILNPWFRRPLPTLFAKLEVCSVLTVWNVFRTNLAMISLITPLKWQAFQVKMSNVWPFMRTWPLLVQWIGISNFQIS